MSEHFKKSELACRCGCGFDAASDALITLAEAVRNVLGCPMIVHCCCRCASHNKVVGGSATSKHLTGDAMDFHTSAYTPQEAYDMIISAYEDGKLPLLGGIGLYSWGIHIDTAKASDGHLRRWKG